MDSAKGSDAPRRKIARVSAPGAPSAPTTSQVDKARLIQDLSDRLSQANEKHDRLLERYQAVSVADKVGEIKDLSDKLNNANEAYDRLHEKYRACQLSSNFFKGGFPICFMDSNGDSWGKNLMLTCLDVNQWVFSDGLNHVEDMEKMAKKDKQFIINSLQGYCAQEDFDYLIPRFTEPARYSAPKVFLAMFIIRDLVEQFYRKPFWYMGPDPVATKHDARKIQQQVEFANQLDDLGKKFAKADRELYELWRVATCRLANIYDDKDRGQDYEFGESTNEYRQSRIRSMIADVLSKKTAQLLLKDASKIKPGDKPFDNLLKVDQEAAQCAVSLSFWDIELEIHTPDTIGPTFHHESESMQTATRHFHHPEDPRLDGKRILGLTMPGLFIRSVPRWTMADTFEEIQVWKLKAHVLVEEMGPLPEVYVPPKKELGPGN
ncbi:hypothetical protein BJY00DRAFT_316796 [Aspergillus carlsbadensis]|nr:hypothetical protein BJY00DRAFT_316796 [Aspergillus carlsbadensis]